MLPDGGNTISDRRRGDPLPLQIASTALEQSYFVNSRVDGIPTSLLVDTGSAVTIVHQAVSLVTAH